MEEKLTNKDLFGNEIKSEYAHFVEKFETKLTTDDCFTPPNIYEFIRSYVCEQCGIGEETRIIRPFKPQGNYEAEDYSGDCVVIDNPPFSILSKICRYYDALGVRYFLFAPSLTIFSTPAPTKIIASAEIIYENGAIVRTGFVSNMFGDVGVIADPEYRKQIRKIQDCDKPKFPKYQYPDNVVTANRLQKIVERGGEFVIKRDKTQKVSGLDDQKRLKKGIFGSGVLISDDVAEELRAEELRAEELRAEELRAEELRAEEYVEVWRLSKRELDIIERLGHE